MYRLLGDAYTLHGTLRQALDCGQREDRASYPYPDFWTMSWNAVGEEPSPLLALRTEPDAEMLAAIEGLGWMTFC